MPYQRICELKKVQVNLACNGAPLEQSVPTMAGRSAATRARHLQPTV